MHNISVIPRESLSFSAVAQIPKIATWHLFLLIANSMQAALVMPLLRRKGNLPNLLHHCISDSHWVICRILAEWSVGRKVELLVSRFYWKKQIQFWSAICDETCSGCPVILVFQLCLPYPTFPSYSYFFVFLLDKFCHEHQNSVNFAVNIKTSQILPPFFCIKLKPLQS